MKCKVIIFRKIRLSEILSFWIGFLISSLLTLSILYKHNKRVKFSNLNPQISKNTTNVKYNTDLAQQIFNNVRILCWVVTIPENHKKKVAHVKKTWAHKCNKLLIMSHATDPDDPDIIALPLSMGRDHLWTKTRFIAKFTYENYYNEADWFLKADDDNFIVMENLRHFLAQYNPQTALYIGHRYAIDYEQVRDGYMAGGGYILSKKALKKFVHLITTNNEACRKENTFAEDSRMGKCLYKHAIFVDAHDMYDQKQMFSIGVDKHLDESKPNMSFWYWQYNHFRGTTGGLGCCSDIYIGSHYVKPQEMYLMEYLMYKVQPFGLRKNLTEKIPRKLTLDEVIKASDAESASPNFRVHKNIHYLDEDEKY